MEKLFEKYPTVSKFLKDHEVISSPQRISMLPKLFRDPKEMLEFYNLHKDLKPIEHPYPGADLVSTENTYLVVDHAVKKVVYFMEWTTRHILNKVAAYQIMVWSDPAVKEIRGYAPKVFFKHLFQVADLVCTDEQQTKDGERFWGSVVKAAYDSNLHVYLYDVTSEAVQEIPNWEAFDTKERNSEIWGPTPKFVNKLLLISQESL